MNLEKPYLLVFFGVLLLLGVGNFWDYNLQHEFPYGYLASDTFQQQTRAAGISDAGNYRFEPFYIVKGFEDVVGYYPPVIHHLGVVLRFATGTPVYDTTYFMVFFNAIMATLVMYIIIRRYNKQIAILSLPLSILIFSNKAYIGFVWGHWASLTGQMLLLCVFWAISRLEIKKIEILLGIFLGALALSHTSELIYVTGFLAIYCVSLLILKKLDFVFVKKMFTAGIISGVLAAYSLFIFMNSFMVVNPYSFEVSTDWGGTPTFLLTDFMLLLIPLAIGAVLSLLMFKKFRIPILIGFFMLLIGYTNYIGFGIRAFQPRFLWPVYFSFFFGLSFYMLIKFVPSKFKTISTLALSVLFILALSNVIAIPKIPTYNKISTSGLMSSEDWEGFQWISENTNAKAKIYYFYGDVYNQDAILRNSKRFHSQVEPDDFIAALQEQKIKRSYKSEIPADHGAGMPYLKSFLSIGLHSEDYAKSSILDINGSVDICIFDYVVFNKASRQPVLAQYNILIANEMLQKGANLVFENQLLVILKNNNIGAECIEERNF